MQEITTRYLGKEQGSLGNDAVPAKGVGSIRPLVEGQPIAGYRTNLEFLNVIFLISQQNLLWKSLKSILIVTSLKVEKNSGEAYSKFQDLVAWKCLCWTSMQYGKLLPSKKRGIVARFLSKPSAPIHQLCIQADAYV